MASVKLEVAGRGYTLSCAPGEEGRVLELVARIDKEAQAIASKMSFVSESKLLLMTALQMADLADSAVVGQVSQSAPDAAPANDGIEPRAVASILDEVTMEIEAIAAGLAKD